MGCGYPPQTKENELKLEKGELISKDNKKNKDISFILYQKIEKLIKLNPFYKIKLSEFEESLNSIKNSNVNENNKIIDIIISTFFKKEESFVKTLFIKTIEHSIKKYDLGLNSENNNDLVISIITLIYIFLTDNKQGKKDLFRKNIINLLNNKNKNNDEISNKIKQYFEVENEEEFIILEENQIYKISDSIYESININNFITFIFFAENHIY